MMNVLVLVAMIATAVAFAAGLTVQAGLPLFPVLIGTIALLLVMAGSYFRMGRRGSSGGDRLDEFEQALEVIDSDLQRLDKVEDGMSHISGLQNKVAQLDKAVAASGAGAGPGSGELSAALRDVYARIDAVRADIATENQAQREKVAEDFRAVEMRIASLAIGPATTAAPAPAMPVAMVAEQIEIEIESEQPAVPELVISEEPDTFEALELDSNSAFEPDPAFEEISDAQPAESPESPSVDSEQEPPDQPIEPSLEEVLIDMVAASEELSNAPEELVPDETLIAAQSEPVDALLEEPLDTVLDEPLKMEEQSDPPTNDDEDGRGAADAEPEGDVAFGSNEAILASALSTTQAEIEESKEPPLADAEGDDDFGFGALEDEDDAMLELVREGIEQGRVDLYLQPTVALPDRKVRYFEGLTRIRKVDGDIVMPRDYMPVAKRSALMPLIDNVLVVRAVQVLRRLGPDAPIKGIFANISMHSLLDLDYFPELIEFMEENRNLSEHLVFQISQAEMQGLNESELECLDTLGALGFTFCLDNITDLEGGFDGLGARNFRFAKVSAARFLEGPGRNAADLKRRLDGMNIELIIEKVETESTIADLLDQEIEHVQGSLFAEPQPMNAALSRELSNTASA